MVLTVSTRFPKMHPRSGSRTYFVEKIWKALWDGNPNSGHNPAYPHFMKYDEYFPPENGVLDNIHNHNPKIHTIRGGNRWKVGDTLDIRIWTGIPYRTKQLQVAETKVLRVDPVRMEFSDAGDLRKLYISNKAISKVQLMEIATNDGLNLFDMMDWFKSKKPFTGQIIFWSDAKTSY